MMNCITHPIPTARQWTDVFVHLHCGVVTPGIMTAPPIGGHQLARM
jgi:hypothetical protein